MQYQVTKRCCSKWVNAVTISNVIIACVYLGAVILSNKLPVKRVHELLPLFVFPFFHFILMGALFALVMIRPWRSRLPVLCFILIVAYINTSYWGFMSEEFKTESKVKDTFKRNYKDPFQWQWRFQNQTMSLNGTDTDFNVTLGLNETDTESV